MPRRQALTPTEVVNLIPFASTQDLDAEKKMMERKAKRKAYDKAHPIVSFFVPGHLQGTANEIKSALTRLAREHMSTETSVSMAFTEWALSEVRSGRVLLNGRPDARGRRMAVAVVEAGNRTWQTPHAIPELQKEEKPEPMFVGWRWTSDIKRQVDALASDHLPVGEVVIRLLEYALNAYREGRFSLKTQSVEVRQAVHVESRW